MKHLQANIPDYQARFLAELAESEKLSVSQIVRLAIALLEKEIPKL